MNIYAYLRASTDEQNVLRAERALEDFVKSHSLHIKQIFEETVSGASTKRPQLERLLTKATEGDILLVEQIDRLTRLSESDWLKLKSKIESAGIRVVSLDLPTSHMFLKNENNENFTGAMMRALNSMFLDLLSAVSRKDYEDRRRRQREGIESAKIAGKYNGRVANQELHEHIKACVADGLSVAATAKRCRCSKSTVARVKRSIGD